MNITDIQLLIDTCEKGQKAMSLLLDAIEGVHADSLPFNSLVEYLKAKEIITSIDTSKWSRL